MEPITAMRYSIVIPVYNTTQVLRELRRRIGEVFSSRIGQPYEIIFVDDGSPNPDTWPTVEALVREDHHSSAIRLTRNFGQHAALLCGLTHARGEYILTMDDDLQHAPEDIPALIGRQDHDVVIGQFLDKKHSLFRNLGSRLKAYFDRIISGKPRDLRVSTFCLIRRDILDQMLAISNTPYPLFSSLIFYVTRDVVGVPVSHSPRREGKSGYSTAGLFRLISRLFINNPGLLFRMVIWCGSLFFAVSLILLSGLLLWDLMGKDSTGWVFLGLLLLLSNGFILIVLGVLGISLSRIAATAEQRKSYLVRQRIY